VATHTVGSAAKYIGCTITLIWEKSVMYYQKSIAHFETFANMCYENHWF